MRHGRVSCRGGESARTRPSLAAIHARQCELLMDAPLLRVLDGVLAGFDIVVEYAALLPLGIGGPVNLNRTADHRVSDAPGDCRRLLLPLVLRLGRGHVLVVVVLGNERESQRLCEGHAAGHV